jgi:hypothetical protein
MADGNSTTRPKRWLLFLPLVLIAVLAAGLAIWLGRGSPPPDDDVLLVVFVCPDSGSQPLLVESPGALPVHDGGSMNLEVQHRQPGCAYLVWIDSSGKGAPLYPWNNSMPLEVTDLKSPPPVRRPGTTVKSPNSFGGGWPFQPGNGMETVLLLSRAAPLPEGTDISQWLGELPSPPAIRNDKELVILEVRDHAKEVKSVLSRDRGDEAAAKAADEPLRALLLRLAPHFDLVRAVRFAHVAAAPAKE